MGVATLSYTDNARRGCKKCVFCQLCCSGLLRRCSLLDGYRRFGQSYNMHLWKLRQYVSPKYFNRRQRNRHVYCCENLKPQMWPLNKNWQLASGLRLFWSGQLTFLFSDLHERFMCIKYRENLLARNHFYITVPHLTVSTRSKIFVMQLGLLSTDTYSATLFIL